MLIIQGCYFLISGYIFNYVPLDEYSFREEKGFELLCVNFDSLI